jgi:hypothetical protein
MVAHRTSALLGLGLLLSAAPLSAQHVDADIVVRSRPVSGRVVVDHGHSTYRRPAPVVVHRPARRVVVVERHAPRVVVVERAHRHGRHHRKWWVRRGYRPVTVYYVDGRYYDRYDRHRPGIREVVVYERDGRYYRDWDDRYDRDYRDDRYDHDRDRDYRDDYRDRRDD